LKLRKIGTFEVWGRNRHRAEKNSIGRKKCQIVEANVFLLQLAKKLDLIKGNKILSFGRDRYQTKAAPFIILRATIYNNYQNATMSLGSSKRSDSRI